MVIINKRGWLVAGGSPPVPSFNIAAALAIAVVLYLFVDAHGIIKLYIIPERTK